MRLVPTVAADVEELLENERKDETFRILTSQVLSIIRSN